MNFIALNDSSIRMRRQGDGQLTGKLTGTLMPLAYLSELLPVNASQSMPLVAFPGETDAGVPVEARIVCDIQNMF